MPNKFLIIGNTLVDELRTAIQNASITPPEIISADGIAHRFHVDGDKRGSRNGEYCLYPDFPPNGYFKCYKRGLFQKIQLPFIGNFSARPPSSSPHIPKHKEQKCRREEEKRQAVAMWERATPATDGCKYLRDKRVKSHGLRYYKNALILPALDCNGKIHGVQRIWPDGSKGFASGTDKTGHFFLIGTIKSDTILIAEGYATAATLHEITGHAVIVAFDAGNLRPVAQAIRSEHPGTCIIICADNDWWTEGNPGLTSAAEAAKAINGLLVVPKFCNSASKPTDFNDLLRCEGVATVQKQLSEACEVTYV